MVKIMVGDAKVAGSNPVFMAFFLDEFTFITRSTNHPHMIS